MKSLSKFFGKVLLACLCAAFVSTSVQAADYKAEYKLSTIPGPTSGWSQTAFYFAEIVKEKTQGRINIKVYPAGQLMAGKQTNEFQMLRNGAIDFSLSSPINWSGTVKELNVFLMPFMAAVQPNPYKAMDAVVDGSTTKLLEKIIEKKGVKVFGWSENGFRQLTTSKGPITSPESLKGLKIRVVSAPIFTDALTALGANPQAINWSEAVTGFQQGLVDGQENPTNGVNLSVKIWQYHKFNCNWNFMLDPLIMAMNPKVFKDFTPEDQKIILECADLTKKFGRALSRVGLDDGSALAYLKSINKVPAVTDPEALLRENGMTVTNLDSAATKAFFDATKGVREKWAKTIGADVMKAVQADMASAK